MNWDTYWYTKIYKLNKIEMLIHLDKHFYIKIDKKYIKFWKSKFLLAFILFLCIINLALPETVGNFTYGDIVKS